MGRRPGCSAGADRWILMTSPGRDFTYVCLVTVLPPSSLVMGFASAGLKSRQCLVLNQHLHAVPPAVSVQPRGEARQKAPCSTLSNLDFTPGALGSKLVWSGGGDRVLGPARVQGELLEEIVRWTTQWLWGCGEVGRS